MFRNGFWVSFSRPSLGERHLTKIDGSKVFACLRKSNSLYLAFSLNFVGVSYSLPTIAILILGTFSCSLSVGLLFSLYNLLSLITFLSVAFHLFMSSSWVASRGSETTSARSTPSFRKDFTTSHRRERCLHAKRVSPLANTSSSLPLLEFMKAEILVRMEDETVFCFVESN